MLVKLRAMSPVHFTWNETPGDGEQIGFFAQDLNEVAPEAVTVGEGELGDLEFVPWGTDNSKLVPSIVAALQAIDRRVSALEAM